MTQQVRTFARRSLWVLPVWALTLFLGTLTHQPDPQTDFGGFSAYVTTTSFLLSHLINSITGAAIGSIGGEPMRSEEHTSELQSHLNLVCRLLLLKKK